MSQKEHVLMIAMFAREARLHKIIFEILRTRGILETSDAQAFEALVVADPKGISDLIDATEKVYRNTAIALGVTVPLEDAL